MSTVDLNDLPANATLSIAREETAGERAVRLFRRDSVCGVVGLCRHHHLDQCARAAQSEHQRRRPKVVDVVAHGRRGWFDRLPASEVGEIRRGASAPLLWVDQQGEKVIKPRCVNHFGKRGWREQ